MLSFKQYRKEVEQTHNSNWMNVHGTHAKEKEVEQTHNSNWMNVHGTHAKEKNKLKESEDKPVQHITSFTHSDGILNQDVDRKNDKEKMKNLEKDYPISDEADSAVYEYTKNSRDLNHYLLNSYNKKKPTHPFTDRIKEMLNARNKSFDTHARILDDHAFTTLKHPLDTYSGIGFDPRKEQSVGTSKEGNKVYYQPTYNSSSISKERAQEFAEDNGLSNKGSRGKKENHILHWIHKSGQPICAVGSNSEYDHEHEVLVPRTESTPERYHVEHLGTDTYENIYGDKYHVHHVRRIPESEIIKNNKED